MTCNQFTLFLVVTLGSLIFSFDAKAREVIQNYDSQIIIDADSSLNITETITVIAEGKAIKRGIYRDFPTRYKDHLGNNIQVEFNLLSVLRNGQPEDYHTEAISNGIRIYIGNKQRFLKHGTHTFTIKYYTHRQLGFFDDYDELYWNVTGNDWAFPILQTSASIQLPPGVSTAQIETNGYSGAKGDKGKNFIVSHSDDYSVTFETITDLPVRHGLSIVVNWPKGYVKEPSNQEKLTWFFTDNQSMLIGFSGLIVLWLYLYFAWLKVGKDPEGGVIYPRYEPDKEHSPASMRFVQKMGYDKKSFTAALVNMAVKGYLNISEGSHFSIKKTGQNAKLSMGESAIARKLFSRGDQIELKKSQHDIIGKAISTHKKVLKRDYEKTFFFTNKGVLVPGWILSIIVLIASVLSIKNSEAQSVVGFMTIWLSFWSIGVTFLLFSVYDAWRKVDGMLSIVPAIFMTVFSIPFIGGEIFGLYMMWESAGFGLILIFILIIITNILFYEWMKAPTHRGREFLDKIEGFKLYLSVAESEEMKQKYGQDLTPELFEKYLPYAIALDVENQWSERFNDVFSHLETQGHHHSPGWYRGHHWNTHNLTGFSSAMGSSLNSAVASSSTAPGSSSGSGGGGSSGGGGGGGGGGGW